MYRKTFTFDGKRYDVRANTLEELVVKIAMKKRDLEEGHFVINKNIKVSDWFSEFMETYKEKSVSPETYDDYLSRWNSKIKPYIGHMKIKDVKPVHCQRVLYEMEGHSKDYISKVQNTMYQMFRRAVQNNLILKNPAEFLEVPNAVDGTHRAITEEERKFTYQVIMSP